MLSRIAESLFWIGRYIERSDGTARILDVHLQLLLEDPWIEEDIACRSLLSVMGVGMFAYGLFYIGRQLPASAAAPRLGQKAPDFSLPDQNGKLVTTTPEMKH